MKTLKDFDWDGIHSVYVNEVVKEDLRKEAIMRIKSESERISTFKTKEGLAYCQGRRDILREIFNIVEEDIK